MSYKTQRIREVEVSHDTKLSDNRSALLMGKVNCDDSLPWNITLDIFGSRIAFKIDTGADIIAYRILCTRE